MFEFALIFLLFHVSFPRLVARLVGPAVRTSESPPPFRRIVAPPVSLLCLFSLFFSPLFLCTFDCCSLWVGGQTEEVLKILLAAQ